MKIFGIELFKKKENYNIIGHASNALKDSQFIPDFYSRRLSGLLHEDAYFISSAEMEKVKEEAVLNATKKKGRPKKVEEVVQLTPKGIYMMKTLDEKNFGINVDPTFLKQQIQSFKDRLSITRSSEFDYENGVREIASMLIRLENRYKYDKFEKFYSDYPYTTTKKINELVKTHSHLQIGKVEQFIADMPNEAVEVMKGYTKETEKLCSKKPLYYIIADKKDFKKTDSRKDPILLAQSPFGHFWQILGAWDEEMLLLEEL